MRYGKYGEPSSPSAHLAGPSGLRPEDMPLPETSHGREAGALAAIGFGKGLIAHMEGRARHNGTTIEQELLASGVREADYYRAIARFLGVAFFERPEARMLADSDGLDTQLLRPEMLRLHPPGRPPLIAIVPEARRLAELTALADRLPGAREAMAVSTPRAVRAAVWQAGGGRRVRRSVSELFERHPRFSARITFAGRQGFYAGALLATLVFLLATAPMLAGSWLHAVLSLFYCAGLLFRAAALLTAPPEPATPACDDRHLPVYTVIVALYREREVAAQLVAALGQLDWPVSRLDIKLVCEADDAETIEALSALDPGPQFEIVAVPPMEPRTKPKALTYALNGARGEFTAVYDAEDRPHPGQLREAHARFRAGPDNLACLQAPLHITNIGENTLSTLFALEYAGLFRCFLPMLARFGLPLPLGGTSNHFRTDLLRAAGAWDPFNVTEDADLGMRLRRLGYRCGTITLPTLEDAPTGLSVWAGQRSRWYKGWLQIWLVMTRRPWRTACETGLAAYAAFQLTIFGMLVSALMHPLLIVFAGYFTLTLAGMTRGDFLPGGWFLFVIDVANIVLSYLTFLALGRKRMTEAERERIGWRWCALPFYWIAMSCAAWRALPELGCNPFFWKKTPHRASRPQ